MMLEQEPTHSVELEMALLGSYMLDPVAFKQTRCMVSADSFYRPSHQDIFRAIEALELQGKCTEPRLVIQWLRDKGKLEDKGDDYLTELGGEDYVLQVADFVPSAASAVHYARVVAEKAELRAYHLACRNVISKINNGTEVDEVRALIASLPSSAKRPCAFLDLATIDHTEDDLGITSGISGIDANVATSGYPRGQASYVSAYHKSGKSTFMVQSFCHMANLGYRVLYATFADLNAKRLKRRMLRALSGWSKLPADMDLFSTDAIGFQNALKNIETLWEGEIFDASKTDSDTVESFLGQVEARHLERPYDCVFVDYFQKLHSDNHRAKFGRVAELDWISSRIARAAERLDLAFVVGSQITEGGKEGRTITKGSRAPEEDGGLVLRIKREDQTKATIMIEYSRFGGMGTEINCLWDPRTLTFIEDPR